MSPRAIVSRLRAARREQDGVAPVLLEAEYELFQFAASNYVRHSMDFERDPRLI